MKLCTFYSGVLLLLLVQTSLTTAQAVEVSLTQVGAPTWRPADFQLFTAPASPYPDEFFSVVDTLLPLEGPSAAVYTPHSPPYDTELSAGAAAGSYESQAVFVPGDILQQPNAVYFAFMMLPDPGVTGSSRDFASGPVIPNSMLPIARNVDVWLDGSLVDGLTGSDGNLQVRPGDAPYDGASHRANVQVIWAPWDDDLTAGPLGNYELRQSLRDVQGNGWDIVAPFQVVPEPSGIFVVLLALGHLLVLGRRRQPKTSVCN